MFSKEASLFEHLSVGGAHYSQSPKTCDTWWANHKTHAFQLPANPFKQSVTIAASHIVLLCLSVECLMIIFSH